MNKFFYRYSEMHLSGGSVKVFLSTIPVLKETPKGVWVGNSEYDKKFVLLSARKRYACETVEEARESFIRRKKRQISILTAQLQNAKAALRAGESPDLHSEVLDIFLGVGHE